MAGDDRVSVSFAVMAHEDRRGYVDELCAQLPPGTRVEWDTRSDRWDTGRRALLAFDIAAEWHVVVQDDAVPCVDFAGQARAALAELGERPGPVSFYAGATNLVWETSTADAMARARRAGSRWIEGSGPWWGLAVAIRTGDIPGLVERCDKMTDVPPYDRRLGRYFRWLERPCLYTVPSLVNHRDGPTLIGDGRAPRTWKRLAAYHDPGGNTEWLNRGEPIRLSFAVQAHPSRAEYIEHVAERLPGVPLALDIGAGQWETARRAWAAYDPGATVHVVLQDDAVLCADFERRVAEEALRGADDAVSLYLGREVPPMARAARQQLLRGTAEVSSPTLYWGVALALPTRWIPNMLAWTARRKVPEHWKGRRSDTRIGKYVEHIGRRFRYPLPSLVDHRVGPSLFPVGSETPAERVAFWWADNPRPKGAR
jgi:hypothetical protein